MSLCCCLVLLCCLLCCCMWMRHVICDIYIDFLHMAQGNFRVQSITAKNSHPIEVSHEGFCEKKAKNGLVKQMFTSNSRGAQLLERKIEDLACWPGFEPKGSWRSLLQYNCSLRHKIKYFCNCNRRVILNCE